MTVASARPKTSRGICSPGCVRCQQCHWMLVLFPLGKNLRGLRPRTLIKRGCAFRLGCSGRSWAGSQGAAPPAKSKARAGAVKVSRARPLGRLLTMMVRRRFPPGCPTVSPMEVFPRASPSRFPAEPATGAGGETVRRGAGCNPADKTPTRAGGRAERARAGNPFHQPVVPQRGMDGGRRVERTRAFNPLLPLWRCIAAWLTSTSTSRTRARAPTGRGTARSSRDRR